MSDYLAGTQIQAGYSVATVLPDFDFETYSEAGARLNLETMKWVALPGSKKKGIGAVNAAVYAEHPSTEVLSMWYDLKDGTGRHRWLPGDPPPQHLFDHIARGGLLEAHNSGFEYLIWLHVCHRRMGWPELPLEQLRCSASKCRAHSLPGSLKGAGEALGLAAEAAKDKEGQRVMLKLSQPRNPTKTNGAHRWTPQSAPDDFTKLYDYNEQDIVAESNVSQRVPDLSPSELTLWLLDQRINYRGVAIDTTNLRHCIAVVNQATERYTAELQQITAGTVNSAGEIAKIQGWLGAMGLPLSSLDADSVSDALAMEWLPDHVRRVLEIRASLGAASVKKLFAMNRTVNNDGRLRELFAYCGADRTGRFAGRGAQPQNFPNSGPKCRQCDPVNGCGHYYGTVADWCPFCGISSQFSEPSEWCPEAIDDFLAIMATEDLDVVERFLGDAIAAVSGCLRGMFTAAPGHDLLCSDYSAIEGVVAAMLAGEQWRIDVFRDHGKIYEMGASKITGIPFEEMMEHKRRTGDHHPSRKKIGKVSELASGFGGWINAWKNFGAGDFMTDQEIKEGILAWREASPAIVEMWGGQSRKHPSKWEFTPELFGLEGAVVQAILHPGQCFGYRGIAYGVKDDVLYCRLLSGRMLTYHQPRLMPVTARNGQPEYQISYMGVDSYTKKWTRLTTYSGKLFENVVQATARDILTHAMVNLEAAGYPIVLHVHDEIVSEVPAGTGSIEEFEAIMARMPEWAADWPIKAAGGWRGKRYRKD